jgi:hypothetical protein
MFNSESSKGIRILMWLSLARGYVYSANSTKLLWRRRCKGIVGRWRIQESICFQAPRLVHENFNMCRISHRQYYLVVLYTSYVPILWRWVPHLQKPTWYTFGSRETTPKSPTFLQSVHAALQSCVKVGALERERIWTRTVSKSYEV